MLKNKRHAEFVNNYFFHNFNATRAYMATYDEVDESTAASNASRLLRNDKVALEIKERFDARAMKADEVIDRLSQIARGDIADFVDDYGGFDIQAARKARKTHLLKKVKQRTIRKMGETKEDGTTGEDVEIHDIEFEAYSAHEALRDLAKVHALFVDRTRNDSDALTMLLAMKNEGKLTAADIPNLTRDFGENLVRQLFGATVEVGDAGDV